MAEFSADVYSEAQRIEAQHNSTGGPREITASMILDAANYVRGPFKTRRRDWKDACVFGGSTISAIGLGVVSNQLDKSWGPLVGIMLAAILAFFGTISFMRGN
ncbi:hypothetical protein [Kribbella pratensis]|uniref:hypothetical protein n=1 Tax=Kribbella pratensis TaxID=2512112 RepID=UPI001065DD6D|nr:hypothetical protein [Kribbella pratensis]